MTTPKHPVKILLSKGTGLFIAVLLTATVAPQILNVKPVSATGDGGYPWIDAHALYAAPDYTSSYGYALPCPAKDTQCDQGGSGLMGTVNNVTYGEADTWHYGLRNCTSYAAWKINQVFGVNNISGWGNAYDWDGSGGHTQPYTVYAASGHTPQVGEIAQWEAHTGDSFGHVAYVWKVETNGVADLWEYNQAYDGNFSDSRTTASGSDGTPDHYIHIGTVSSGTSSRYALTNGGGALYAADYLNSGLTGESSPGDALKIAVGGAYQVREDGCGEMVWASSPGSAWQAITNCGVVTNVAVGSGGVFMYQDNCGAVYTNNTPSMTGWHNVTGCGVKAISAGGSNIAYVDSTNTAYASYTWNGAPNRVSNVGDATNIADPPHISGPTLMLTSFFSCLVS
jgi:surface antigen